MTDQLTTSPWQPIETAPKDGTLIMLDGGSWEDDFEEFDGVMIARWDGESWLIAALEAGYACAEYHHPTHWRHRVAGWKGNNNG